MKTELQFRLRLRRWNENRTVQAVSKSGIQDLSQNAGGLLQADSVGNENYLILPIFAEQTNLETTPTRSQVNTSIDKIYWPKWNGQINHNDNGYEKGDLANATQ